MRGRTLATLLPVVLFACGGGTAAAEVDPAATAAKIVGAALVQGKAFERLAYLSDRIGPRLSGSSQLEEAVRWTAAEMRADGLDRVWTERIVVPHWVRGTETARLVSPAEHPLAVTALGGSVSTPPEGVTAEVVLASSFEELRALGADAVRGKIVLYHRKMVRNGGETDGYGPVAKLRSDGASEAAKLGAVATVLRSAGTAAFRLPHTGAMHYADGVPAIPSAAISSEDADLIQRLLAAGEKVRLELVLRCRTLPDAESANVLADLRGRERPDEIVLIGAHLDSWDLGTGAIDDGAGVVIVMDTMRLLKSLGLKPRRTIRAVLFTNEENGLKGGKGYAEAHREELARHVAAIESDMGGAAPLGFGVTTGKGGLEIVRELASHLASIQADDVRDGGGGADISPLKSAGVPQLSLRQDSTYYFDYHHSAADTLDKVKPEELSRNVAALAVMAYLLAEREEALPRYVSPGASPFPRAEP